MSLKKKLFSCVLRCVTRVSYHLLSSVEYVKAAFKSKEELEKFVVADGKMYNTRAELPVIVPDSSPAVSRSSMREM